MDDGENAWCQLVCSTDVNAPILYISKESFTIGRSKDCDLRISETNLISGRHCHIFKDIDGEVWLQDNSTNGTLLNLVTRISKGQKHRLKHGDEIHVVYKKNNPDSNIAYLYQDIVELQKESNNSDLQRTADCTLEYDIDAGTEASPVRVPEEEVPNTAVDDPRAVKRIRLDDVVLGDQEPKTTGHLKDVSPAGTTSCEETSGEQASGKDSKAGPSNANGRDDMEETLLCSICQDILHNAVSLQPCMHTFCAACYSSWMTRSKECPTCRINVDRISYNHIVKNLVEVYLKEHPDKQRSDEEIKELDAKNKITKDMLHPQRRHNQSSDYLGSSDSYSGSDDSDTSSASVNIGFWSVFGRPPRSICKQCPNYVPHQNFGRQQAPILVPAPVPNTTSSSSSLCTATRSTAATTSTTVGASAATPIACTSNAQASAGIMSKITPSGRVPTTPQYSCSANADHLVCMCCMDHMPDRRSHRGTVPNLPPQQCSYCSRYFCHMYWGCTKPQCLGCLNQLKDLKFSQDCTRTLVNNNLYESQILMNYIQAKNMTYLELFEECLVRMDSNRYKPASQNHRQTTSSSVFCYICGLTVFKELAYLYRKDIPQNELPNDVTSRPNCYWGKQCRTQVNKPHHARNFNHICDQTRY